MAQFTSYPAARPQPFAIYNNQRSTLMSELGEALTALGNIPQQMQQAQIRNELNKLLLTSLTAPKTEIKETIDPNKFVGGFYDEDEGNVGSYLTQKEVPGEKYTQATSRLEKVGYEGGGFNFRPRTSGLSLEDRLLLKEQEGAIKKEIEGVKTTGKEAVEEKKQKGRLELQQNLFKQQDKSQEAENIFKSKLQEQKDLAEDVRHDRLMTYRETKHLNDLEVARRNAEARMKTADNMIEISQSREEVNITKQMAAQLNQINKIKKEPDQTSQQTINELRQAIGQYNQLAARLKAVNPDQAVDQIEREDIPWRWGNIWDRIQGALPGGSIPQQIRPNPTPTPQIQTPINPPKPAQSPPMAPARPIPPTSSRPQQETPMQRYIRERREALEQKSTY